MTSRTMRAARLHGVGDVRVEALPVPEPAAGEVLVRIEACGVCPTDARKYAIGVNDGDYPFNPGHEWVGRVVEAGAGVEGLSAGERVYGDTYGGYAEFTTIASRPRGWSRGALPLGDLPVERAVFVEPLADCLHAVHDQAQVAEGDRVAVLGAGSMGLQITAVAARAGAECWRWSRARTGAPSPAGSAPSWPWTPPAGGRPRPSWTGGAGPDADRRHARPRRGRGRRRSACGPGGRVVLFAGFGNEGIASVDLNRLHYREISLVGSEWVGVPPRQRFERYEQARGLLADEGLRLEELVSDRTGLEGVEGALRAVREQRSLKVVLYPGAGESAGQGGERAPRESARPAGARRARPDRGDRPPALLLALSRAGGPRRGAPRGRSAGADAVICSYGTLRDLRSDFGDAAPILKLDLTTLSLGGHYPVSEYALAYRVEDALRLDAAAVLTYVQLGAPHELEALRTAARVAARADELGLPYVCEIMPVEGGAYPDASAPPAIAAAARTAAELGAHLVKTTMPSPPRRWRRWPRAAYRWCWPAATSTPTTAACSTSCGAPSTPARPGWRTAGTSGDGRTRARPCGRCGRWCTRRRSVSDRVALVTGASRGIGRATALALARAGHRVLALARSATCSTPLRRRSPASSRCGPRSTRRRGAREAIEGARRLAGPVTILVNNAGRGGWHDRPIWEQDRDGWRASMAVNLDAPFELTRGLVRGMVEEGWGRIVTVSSTAGQAGAPSMAPYCASKHGVIGLMRAVAQDVAPHGITCNAVLPGWVRTEMADRDAEQEGARRGMTAEAVWAARAAENPAGRVVTPEEVAGVIAYLCSDAAAAVNGEAITVSLGSPW